MIPISFLEQLQQSNENVEIWWDSSPTKLITWMEMFISNDMNYGKRRFREKQLSQFFNPNCTIKSLLRGVTTNPRLIAECMFEEYDKWHNEANRLSQELPKATAEIIYWQLYKSIISAGAKVLEKMWIESNGKYGWISAQVDPRYFLDADAMYQQGIELSQLNHNIMIKVPGSSAGYEVIERLVAHGISVNNTFSYTIPQLIECTRAIKEGLAKAENNNINLAKWRCVITYMIGRFGSQGDLMDQAKMRKIDLCNDDIRWAEIAIFKRFHEILHASGIPAKILLSSIKYDIDTKTGKKSCWHIEKTAGSPTIYTFTPSLLSSLLSDQEHYIHFSNDAHQEAVPEQILKQLNLLPYFANAYSIDGICPNEFHHQGTFMATVAEACASVRRMIDFASNAQYKYLSVG